MTIKHIVYTVLVITTINMQAATEKEPETLTQDTKISENFSFEQIMLNTSGKIFDWDKWQTWLDSQWAGKDYAKEKKETLNNTRVFEAIWIYNSARGSFVDCGTLKDHYSSEPKQEILFEHIAK